MAAARALKRAEPDQGQGKNRAGRGNDERTGGPAAAEMRSMGAAKIDFTGVGEADARSSWN